MLAILHLARLSFRKLRRDPILAGISVVAFTLGIGLTASMFSITYTVLVRGMPFQDPDELLSVTRTTTETGATTQFTGLLEFLDWEEEQSSLQHLGAWSTTSRDLVDEEDRAERVSVTLISPSILPLLGTDPALGRGLGADELGPDARVALVSDGLWRNRYGSDPELLGRVLSLSGESYTVVGIMPPDFAFPDRQDIWLPLPWDESTLERGQVGIRVLGRLPGGTPRARAEAELEAIALRLSREYPETNPPVRIRTVPLVRTFIAEEEMRLLWTMMVASFFVLVIACANVANLLAARALARSQDMAVATALGATRGRIVGELLMEALVLSLIGGAAGVALAIASVDWFDSALGVQVPPWMEFRVDGPILGFILAVSVISALVAGLMPAVRSARVSVREVLQDDSRGASSRSLGKLSSGMVIATMALAYPLLVGAGLLIASFQETSRETTFQREGILTVQLSLPYRRYPDAEARQAFWDQFLEWAEGQPGVTGATQTNWAPSDRASPLHGAIEGVQYLRRDDYPWVRRAVVRPGFFRTLGVTPTRGRLFDVRDRSGPPVAILNQPFADRFFPGQDPLGRLIRIAEGEEGEEPWRTVVGLVPDLRMNGTDQDLPEGFFIPAPPADLSYGLCLLRTRGDPLLLGPAIRNRIATMDAELPIRLMETLEERMDRAFWFVTVIGSVFSAFGAAALFLASVGLYGVMAHSVQRRTRELGVRMALGATRRSVLLLILRQGMVQVGLGLAVGTLFALVGTQLLADIIFGVRPGDPMTMLVVAMVLVGSALAAVVVPAMRAMMLEPVEALRGE